MTPAPPDTGTLEQVWRTWAPDVLAALVRRYGDFDAAEDAAQEALLAAYRQWPEDGVPDHPKGWLIRVGSRRLVDQWRSEQARVGREVQEGRRTRVDDPLGAGGSQDAPDRDDSLALFLLCCHPVLPRPSQVALTLRAVGGLTTGQIARAFLVPEATLGTRISRAKRRLAEVDARLGAVTLAELPDRVDAVAQVLYLIFTEGHTSTTGADLLDISLADEAIRLTRQLHDHLEGFGEVAGLLALMLLTDARRAARTSADGSLITLAEQDRSRWDQTSIAEGVALIERALPVGPVGPYQLQAAIAAVHAEATDAEGTDWEQIEVLYTMLTTIAPSPVVTLNHAVAVAMINGPEAGLALVDPLLDDPQLRHHHRLHAARGHLLERSGRLVEAHQAYALAARLATNIPEQRYLNAKQQLG